MIGEDHDSDLAQDRVCRINELFDLADERVVHLPIGGYLLRKCGCKYGYAGAAAGGRRSSGRGTVVRPPAMWTTTWRPPGPYLMGLGFEGRPSGPPGTATAGMWRKRHS